MSKTGSVQTIMPSQMKELCSAASQSVPTNLPFVVADYWEHNKGELVRKFADVLRSAPVAGSLESPVLAKVVFDCQRALRRSFGRRCPVVDLLPASVTEGVVAHLACYNMRPVFLPGMEITESLKLKNWVKPPAHFYQWIWDGKIAKDAAILRHGWYAADFTVGVDYMNGIEMMPCCPWTPLITRLRAEGRVGKHDETPAGSRFSIKPKDEWETVLTYMASGLNFPRAKVRLERYCEFNAIGNLYDPNRGKFNMWEWFADQFEDSHRLYGGNRSRGGLASVDLNWADARPRSTAARPLVSLS